MPCEQCGRRRHTHTSVGVQCVQCACTTWCVCEEFVGHVSQRQDGNHAVVAVGFDEVVASDGGRVDVVLPERTDKRLEEDRKEGDLPLVIGNPLKIMSFKPATLALTFRKQTRHVLTVFEVKS